MRQDMNFPAHIQANRDENATACHPAQRCGVQLWAACGKHRDVQPVRSKKRYEQGNDPDVKSLPEYFLDSASRCGMTLPVTPHNDAGSRSMRRDCFHLSCILLIVSFSVLKIISSQVLFQEAKYLKRCTTTASVTVAWFNKRGRVSPLPVLVRM